MFKKQCVLMLVMIITVMCLVLSFSDASVTSGQKLQIHGFITGSDSGLDEDRLLTRAEVAVILSELMGESHQAEAYMFPANFTDVSGHWAKAYIAYGQSQEWFGGYPDGSYKPDEAVSTQALASFILNALGYNDYAYDNAVFYLKNLGVDFIDSQKVTRGEAFDIIWKAIQIPKKGKTVPLGVALGKLSYKDLDRSYDEELKIVSFKSINLFEYQLKFNQPVDRVSAENSQHYTISSSLSAAITAARGEYILSQDGKTLSIYLPLVNQNDRLTIRVNNLKSLDGSKVLTDGVAVTTASDLTQPAVLNAQIIGSRVIQFTFSEALKLTDDDLSSAFNAGDLTGADSITYPLVDGQKYHVANVTFNSDFPTNSLMQLKVGELSDQKGLKSDKKSFTLSVYKDETRPVVVDYELIDRNRLGLIWSKPVTIFSDDLNKYYHTNETNIANYVTMKQPTDNEMVLNFDNYSLPLKEGYVYVKAGAVKDLWSNSNAFSMTKFTFDLDSLIPVPQKIDIIDSRRIKVDFSTPINETHETSTSNFTLYQYGKELVIPMSLSFDSIDKDSVTIQFSRELEGDYSLVIEGVKHYDLPSEKATLDFTIE